MSTLPRTHRRPFLTPIWLLVIVVTTLIVLFLLCGWWLLAAPSTLVVLAADAEAPAGVALGTPPSALESSDAERLAQTFGADRFEALYLVPAPGADTFAAPLASRLGLVPTLLPGAAASQLASRVLHEHRGGRVLLIAPVDTVARLLEQLAPGSAPVDDKHSMYIVTVPTLGRPTELRLRY